MFYIFLCCFTVYVLSLLSFPFYKSRLSAKNYIIFNSVVLFSLFCLLSFMFRPLLVLNQTYLFWIDVGAFFSNVIPFSWTISINVLSYLFSFLVVIIGFSTNIYTLNYFRGEADENLFVFWLNAFIASMLCLVFASNFYTLFLGWELIGLTSFFLINFWHTRRGTNKSSFKAFSFNLISDVFLLTTLVCFYKAGNTTDCSAIIYLTMWERFLDSALVQFGLLTLVGCAGIKSVQIGGHLWLPDSMEAPVPASSLIHSATLVSAGIFLIAKFQILFFMNNWVTTLMFIGALTACYGGIVAAAQTDLKKLLAYSTMSHCGFLWILASLGHLYVLGFYLFLHGLFKAATFYCAGSFIRAYGSQDSRWMGGGSHYLRLDTFLLLVCGANLGGLPFTVGFFFKTFFFKIFLLYNFGFLAIGFIFVGLLTSILYFFRLTFYALYDFYKNVKFFPNIFLSINDKPADEGITLSTKNHFVAVLFLFFMALLCMLFFSQFYGTGSLFYESALEINNAAWMLLQLGFLYQTYYIYFYVLYALFIFLLIIGFWRKNIFSLEQCSIIIFFFVGLLLLLRCEVILWRKLILLRILILDLRHINQMFWFICHNDNTDDDFDFLYFELCIFLLLLELFINEYFTLILF